MAYNSFEDVPVVSGDRQRESMAEALANGHAMQQVKTNYTTAVAVQKPRSISKMLSAVLEEAEQAGSSFYYRWEVKTNDGPKEVIGGSIDMAASIFRGYGNCAMDIQCNETPSHYFFTATFIDLENGMSWPRMFRQRKSQSLGKRMEQDRQEDIVFQIGQSKAMRNAVLSVMPRWIVERAIQTARNAEIKRLSGRENITLARAEVMKYFGRFGVTQERIEAKLGKKIEDAGPEDLADLRSVAGAIKDGVTTISDAFPAVEKPEEAKQEEAKTHEKTTLKPAQESPPAVTQPDEPKAGPAEAPPPPAPPEAPKPLNGVPGTNGEPGATGNPFDNRDAYKNFRKGADGLSTFYYRNRKHFPTAKPEAQRDFAAKWKACYPEHAFPGEADLGAPAASNGISERQPGEDSDAPPFRSEREEMVQKIKDAFSPEVIELAKGELGLLTGANQWPPTMSGLNMLFAKCQYLVNAKK